MKPWREIAVPHGDVLAGTFQQSEFAVDLTQVVSGGASPEYQDPEKFFARTYITEGMRLLLISVAQRLTGKAGDPVIQLQTNFGGGKTHTLLAVYHLAARKVSPEKLPGIPAILDDAQITSLPPARVAVIDGTTLSPNQPTVKGKLKINTIWGNLAYQLLGEDGYKMIADSDRVGTAPGKEIFIELLRKAAPCVLLLDELVAFFRQLNNAEKLCAGSYESNVSFIQVLTESVKAVPGAILLASLPDSDTEAAGSFGQIVLTTLEKYFGRLENVWKPVATDESFEIVRRRLFEQISDRNEMEKVCRAYADFYRTNRDKFPPEVQENGYYERLKKSYPIHPEIFDRLYEDWSTLDKFQRTRGVLQYMAIIIHQLWQAGNNEKMIMPGSIPLDDVNVRIKSTHYLSQGWDSVIESEIDGPNSAAAHIDTDSRFGSVSAARRTARTLFLGSAPSSSVQQRRGMTKDRILLGSVSPNQQIGIYEDVLRRLRDRLQYLFADSDRYWFDTRPNLRREMESRKDKMDAILITRTLKEKLTRLCGRTPFFAGIHVFTPHSDIPDEIGTGVRLVLLPPEINSVHTRTGKSGAFTAAAGILAHRGDQPRLNQNRLIFLAPDLDQFARMQDQCKIFLAWKEIVSDIEEERLDMGSFQSRQAKNELTTNEKTLEQSLVECYRYVLIPIPDGPRSVDFTVRRISAGVDSLASSVEKLLCDEEFVITTWSPIHLKSVLQKHYFINGVREISIQKVWNDFNRFFQMPRLLDEKVFLDTVSSGVLAGDFFGYAIGKENDKYLGMEYASIQHPIMIDEQALLIENEKAVEWKAAHEPKRPQIPEISDPSSKNPDHIAEKSDDGDNGNTPSSEQSDTAFKRFYGNVCLHPTSAALTFSDIVKEVIQHFAINPNVRVTIRVDIEAESTLPFDSALIRTVKENTNTLKFEESEFESE